MKVIFHIDELKKWPQVLTNVSNFLKEIEDADILVLANGEAVRFYKEEKDLSKLKDMNAKFLACRNALNANEIKEDEIPNFINTVSAGVVELAKRQEEGYSYIRP